ncbi:MAG: TIGR03862 family flavoprotein [Xanthobacteraceae bacterium]|nr:TIGR03862 family flavoprotein [Xanthobacteraceae bacterium]QYK45744.1 MAG: TIGR03862 family flavoprotein [Xanthobacteraceae bacterium]
MTTQEPVRNTVVIGAGPAGLMAAEQLADAGVAVTVYERMPSPGRKFLLAGRGGLNLTHTEDFESFVARYGARTTALRPAIERFTPEMLRAWSEKLGQKTFAGSSGRVFPEAFKSSPLLRAWLRRLDAAGVAFRFRHRWLGWSDGELLFDTTAGKATAQADAVVLALGGASWPRLGSDGSWQAILQGAGVEVSPLLPANCGFKIGWSPAFRERFEGTPLKRVALRGARKAVRGEAMITKEGLEGGAIYAISSALREEILLKGSATLEISLRPDLSAEDLEKRLAAPRGKQSFSNFLRKSVQLTPAGIALLHEAAAQQSLRVQDMDAKTLASFIHAVPLLLTGMMPVADAISTAGGVGFAGLDENYMLRGMPGVFAAGEMLDWEAPTGGYLLQGCFATGFAAGQGAVRWLRGMR